MQKMATCLWFDGQAEEAAKFYVSVFGGDSRITQLERYGDAGPGPKGSVMTVAFELRGQTYLALNGGPHFKFTPAISLVVQCETQAEIDRFWSALSAGGRPGQCGWLEDRFGLSWQVVPANIGQLIAKGPPDAVMATILQMGKLDLATLERVSRGGAR